jgi:hypothetical protein
MVELTREMPDVGTSLDRSSCARESKFECGAACGGRDFLLFPGVVAICAVIFLAATVAILLLAKSRRRGCHQGAAGGISRHEIALSRALLPLSLRFFLSCRMHPAMVFMTDQSVIEIRR